MSTPKIEKDSQGRWKITGVQNRVIDPTMMDFQQLRSAANSLPGDVGQRTRAILQNNPLASGGILAGLVENGSVPDNELAKTLIDIDMQTKAKREADAFKERQLAETEAFNKTKRGILWRGVKSVARGVLLPGQTILEGVNSLASDIANVGESFWRDAQGIAKGDIDWWTLDSKVPGKTREELGYGEKINPEDYIGPTATQKKLEQITLFQIAEDLFKGKEVNVGQGFFISEESGAGFRARKARIKNRGIEVKMGDRTYTRPYSAVDPITNLITGGQADTQMGSLVTALGEVFIAWKLDPFINVGKQAREVRRLEQQLRTSKGKSAAKNLTQLANAEAELAKANEKTKRLFEAYKISPASSVDEARKAFDNALNEEMAVASRVDDLIDTGYDVNAIGSFLSSTKSEAIIDWLANATRKQIWELGKAGPRKTGFTFQQAIELGKATTRDEVLRVLAPYIANGSVVANVLESGTRTGQLLSKIAAGADSLVPNTIKGTAARVVKQLPFISKVANITNTKAYGFGVRKVDALRRAYNTVVPAQSMVHFADTDLLANHIRDYGRITNVSDEAIDGILDGLAASDDVQTGSYDAVKKLMAEIVAANTARGIDPNLLKKVTEVFDSAKIKMSTYWADRHAAGAKLEYMFNDGKKVSLSGPHLESELLNSMFYFPDTKELLDTISVFNKVPGLKNTRRGADFLVGNIWKKFILVRPAYTIRNIMEEQIRVFGTGHVSFFNSPLTAMAMWLGREGDSKSWRRLLASFDPYRNTVTDDAFKLGSTSDEFSAEVAAHGTISDYLTYIQDNTNTAMERDAVRIKQILGYANVQYKNDRFWEGIANEVRMLRNTLAARVAILNEANPQKAVDYLLRGEGREQWTKFAKSKDAEVRDFLLSDEGLMMYLYTGKDDAGRSISLMARIEEVAGNGGPGSVGIKNLIASGEFRTAYGTLKAPTAVESAANSIKNAREVAKGRKSLQDVNEEFAEQLKTFFDGQGDWTGINFKLPLTMTYTEFNKPTDLIDSFFNITVKFEKQTTMGPEWRQKYWDAIDEIALALDADAAQRLATVAEKSLSPLVSWSGKAIGREHSVWKAFKSAKGDGNITLDEAHAYASQVASKHVANLFYDASKKRLLYHQLRLIAPFGQAWDDTIQAWGRIALDNPDQVYKLGKSLEWLTSPESSTLYELTDARDIYDPNQGFFFTDQRSGQRKLFIPFLGTGLNFLTNLMPGGGVGPSLQGAVALSATPQSFNFAFASGSIMPGIGPGITFPVATLDALGIDPLNLLPAGLRNFSEKLLFPFGKPNVQEGVIETFLLSGNWRRVLSGPFVEASYGAAFTPVMSYLTTTGDYNLDDVEDQSRLINDATSYAKWFTVFRGLFGFISAAPPQLEELAKDDNGNTILATALYKDFKDIEVASGGDYNKAYGEFIDLYGPQALFSLIGATTGGPTNHLTYEMLQKDPSVIDKYADTYGYFYPGGGFSQELYNWQRRTNRRERLSAQEITEKVTSIRYYAARDRLLTRAMAENWDPTRLEEARSALTESYGMRGLKQEGDIFRDVRRMNQLREAVNDPRFVDSDAVDGLRRYLFFRDAALKGAGKKPTGTLESKGTIEQRKWLAEKALEIIQENPEFYKMFYSFFYRELDVE